jgi:hypothetical protein
MRRIPTLLATTAVFFLLFASVALAQESGAGPVNTNDKLITEIGLALIFGFPVFLLFASWLQSALDKRKHRKMDAHRGAAGAGAWKGGW